MSDEQQYLSPAQRQVRAEAARLPKPRNFEEGMAQMGQLAARWVVLEFANLFNRPASTREGEGER